MRSLKNKYNYELISDALEASNGNISSAAKRLNLSRSELLDYIESDSNLKEVVIQSEERLKDITEQNWFSLMFNENTDQKLKFNMLKYTLSTKCKDRGWGLTAEQNFNIVPSIQIDSVYTKAHNEELETKEKSLVKQLKLEIGEDENKQ